MMNPIQLIEIVCAGLILGAGIFVYRRKPAKDDPGGENQHYDTQGAVDHRDPRPRLDGLSPERDGA